MVMRKQPHLSQKEKVLTVCALKKQELRTPRNRVIVSLAISDSLLALFQVAETFLRPLYVGWFSLVTAMPQVFVLNSYLHLLLLAVDRYYLAMFQHEDYQSRTAHLTRWGIPFIWLLSWLPLFPILLCFFWQHSLQLVAKIMAVLWIVFIVLFVSSVGCIYTRVGTHLFHLDSQHVWLQRPTERRNYGRLIRQMKGFIAIICVSVIAFLPTLYILITTLTGKPQTVFDDVMMELIATSILIGCAINPIVYVLILREFRETFKHIITCQITCPPERRVVDEIELSSE
ncbi:melanocortin receptor 5-like [Symsagittifera roscoffensis]|uniref:melanocortin receptor 5-like n=1 Tax=Symsagittifera roscoffensis TaxID=84072 RepID=UPI00307B81E1